MSQPKYTCNYYNTRYFIPSWAVYSLSVNCSNFACSWKTLDKCSVPFYVHLVWKFVIIQALVCNSSTCTDDVLCMTSTPLISELKTAIISCASVPPPIFHFVRFLYLFSAYQNNKIMKFSLYEHLRLNISSFDYRLRVTDFPWLL